MDSKEANATDEKVPDDLSKLSIKLCFESVQTDAFYIESNSFVQTGKELKWLWKRQDQNLQYIIH